MAKLRDGTIQKCNFKKQFMAKLNNGKIKKSKKHKTFSLHFLSL
jgi:hypothetical protein